MSGLTRMGLADLFDEVNMEGGNRLAVYRSPFVNQDGSQNQVILYVRISRTPLGAQPDGALGGARSPRWTPSGRPFWSRWGCSPW